MSKQGDRGAQVLAAYDRRHTSGEDPDSVEGAFTVAADVVTDILHLLHDLGHEDPESVFDLASANYVEERAIAEASPVECRTCGVTVTP
jgi:hypothetical protein